jgi:hypothetical protein
VFLYFSIFSSLPKKWEALGNPKSCCPELGQQC